jgi:hypothetical protein
MSGVFGSGMLDGVLSEGGPLAGSFAGIDSLIPGEGPLATRGNGKTAGLLAAVVFPDIDTSAVGSIDAPINSAIGQTIGSGIGWGQSAQ